MQSESSFSQPIALWSFPAPVIDKFTPFSDPVFDGAALWLVVDGQRLMALDPLTGSPSLDFETPGQVTQGPVIAGGSLILGYRDGTVSSFDLETGTVDWSISASGEITGDLFVSNGIVVAASGNIDQREQVFALEAETGEPLWTVDALTRDGRLFVRSLTASDGVVVATGAGGLLALDEKTGQVCWGTGWSQSFGGASATDGMVFADNGMLGNLAARDIRSGDLLWEADVDMGLGNPAVVDGTVFFGGDDGRLHAVGVSTGETIWQSDAGDFSQAMPVVANGTVLAASRDGLLYAFDATTGAPRWTFTVGPAQYGQTAPLVLGDVIYIGSIEGFHAIRGS
jgi:outer membrane protein assembly factor BamB